MIGKMAAFGRSLSGDSMTDNYHFLSQITLIVSVKLHFATRKEIGILAGMAMKKFSGHMSMNSGLFEFVKFRTTQNRLIGRGDDDLRTYSMYEDDLRMCTLIDDDETDTHKISHT